MAPLSVLPGRLRFEAQCLNGSTEKCFLIEERVKALPGVSDASASHRTGRVLVLFDEGRVSRSEVEEHLAHALQAAATLETQGVASVPARRPVVHKKASSHGVGHFVMEMALHAFLPAPLDLLLPTAAALRR